MPLPQEILGRYRVIGRIATGSLGTVLAAVDERTGREVALKLFDGATDNHASWVDELRLAARLDHPHIATCLDVGQDGPSGLQVLVFTRALGGSLRRSLVSGITFDEEAVTGLLTDIARALAHAHAQQIIHRDVKPENILALERPDTGPWALTDFGAGRFLARGAMADTLVGSRLYMAPEVLLRAAGAAADQFSLGIVGVELMTRALPSGELRARFLHQHRFSPGIAGIITRMIDPDPRRRFFDLDSVIRSLHHPSAAPPPQALLANDRRLTIEDGKVHVADNTATTVLSGRVGRDPAFVQVDGDEVAMIAAGRRLIACVDDSLTTLLTSDHRIEVLAASLPQRVAWIREGDSLMVCDLPFGNPRARAKLPPRILASLAQGPRTSGAILTQDQALFGWPGAGDLLHCEAVGGRIAATLYRVPWPLYRLELRDRAIFGIFGDDAHAHLLALDAGGHRELAQVDLSADAVAITCGDGVPSLRPLIPSLTALITHDDTLSSPLPGAPS